MKLDERTSLLPLILCLMTDQDSMLTMLWNQHNMWNRPVYMILLANFVFETELKSSISQP